MIRCPRCGIRLAEACPSCPLHGPAPPVATAFDAGGAASNAEPFDLPGYRIDATLGYGGFGVVYRATRLADGAEAAMKVAHREQLGAAERLSREARAMRRAGVEATAAVWDEGVRGGRPYLVMELIRAPTLAEILVDHRGPMPLARFRASALALVDAVGRLHSRGIAHADLKPENVLVGADAIKIIDFGLAVLEAEAPTEPPAAATDTGEARRGLGTPEYMAPEQCEGRAVDARTDIYALGILLYEMLSGAPPFFGPPQKIVEWQRSMRPKRLSQTLVIDRSLEHAVLACLAKEPGKRPESCAALRQELEAALVRSGVTDSPLSTREIVALGAPKAPPADAKRTAGIVFFESDQGFSAVRDALEAIGGQLAQVSGTRYIAVFGYESGENPARAALLAAEQLASRGVCQAAIVDLAKVIAKIRPDGSTRLMSAAFSRKDRIVPAGLDRGALLTRDAADVLPELPTTIVAGHPQLLRRCDDSDPNELTGLRLVGGDLLGRDELLSALLTDAARSLSGASPAIATILGEAGHGKTHLASSIALALARVPEVAEVMTYTAHEAVGGAADPMLRKMLARALDLPSAAPADRGRALLVERLGGAVAAQVWPAASLVLGWATPDDPELVALAAAPGALRSAVARALGEALRARAKRSPLVIVIDDGHLADAAVLDALEYATLGEARAPLWVCVIARPGFERGRPAWGGRAARASRHSLAPLDPVSASLLSRRLLEPVENVSRQALARLYERTRGVPRLLVELVRGLKREGAVRRTAHGTGYYLATEELDRLPDLPIVEWAATREVGALAPELVAHARLASVLGSRFSIDDLDRVIDRLEGESSAGRVELDAAVGAGRLVEAGVLVRRRNGLLDFRHPLLRETVYAGLPLPERTAIHRAAYEMFRASGRREDEDLLPRLAFHAAKSGLGEEASSLYLSLADRAQRTHAYIEAELHFDAALANLPAETDGRVVHALKGRGMMRFRVGRADEARGDLEQARKYAAERGEREVEVDILIDEAEVVDWLGDFARAGSLIEMAKASAESVASELVGTRLAVAEGRAHYRAGRLEPSVTALSAAAERADKIGDPAYEAFIIALLVGAPANGRLGRIDEAEAMLDRAIAATTQHGDYHHLAAALNNRAIWVCLPRRQIERASGDLAKVVEIAREIGFAQLEMITQMNLGELLFVEGKTEPALAHAQRAIEVGDRLGTSLGYLYSATNLIGRLLLSRGEIDEARSAAKGLRQRMQHAADEGTPVQMTATDAILLEMIELSVDEADDRAWDDLVERGESAGLQPHEMIELLERRGRAAERRGQKHRAASLFERALAIARREMPIMAERIGRDVERLGGDRASGVEA